MPGPMSFLGGRVPLVPCPFPSGGRWWGIFCPIGAGEGYTYGVMGKVYMREGGRGYNLPPRTWNMGPVTTPLKTLPSRNYCCGR